MKSVRLKIAKFTLSLIYSPDGKRFFVSQHDSATHVHLGKVGFWYRYQ